MPITIIITNEGDRKQGIDKYWPYWGEGPTLIATPLYSELTFLCSLDLLLIIIIENYKTCY